MYSISPIAYIKGCFPDKFGIPRQASLAPHSRAEIVFTAAYQNQDYIRGIEAYSHIWLIFGFHHHVARDKSPLVRPQRLGGNLKMGVFATRSTYRPNNLGLSVMKLEQIESSPLRLSISGHDLCDGTPIFDIKPYLPFNDHPSDAYAYFAAKAPPVFDVYFSDQAQIFLQESTIKYPHLRSLIIEVIAQDPRPSYHAKQVSHRIYGLRLYEFNIRFIQVDQAFTVLEIE